MRLPLILTICALSFAGILASSSPAFAQFSDEDLVGQEAEIAEWIARGGAVGVPGVSCGDTCSDLWMGEHEPPVPALINPSDVQEEVDRLRRVTGTLPSWSRIGQIVLRGTAAGGGFSIGWLMGTGIYQKFMTVDIPAVNPATGYIYDYRNIKAKPCNPNWSSCVSPGSPPGAQFYFQTDYYQGDRFKGNTSFVHPENPFNYWPPVPEPFISYTREGDGWTGGVLMRLPGVPIEDYIGQPADRQTPTWPGQPTSEQQLMDRIAGAIESGDYELLEAWLAERRNPRDNDTGTRKDQACDQQSGGTGIDPAPERGTDELARYEKVPSGIAPLTGFSTIRGQTYLRYGRFKDVGNREIDIKGWGYRKIAAKHGWSPEDLAATALALQDPAPRFKATPQLGSTDRYEYLGPEYAGIGGVACRRLVVVEHAPGIRETSLGTPAAGIVTSFGKRLP